MRRVLLVSLDGATLELCDRWRSEGLMPILDGIARDGSAAPMRSIFPFNSAVAWTSMATGVRPGSHGIYDFFLLKDGEYRLRPAAPADRHAPAAWTAVSGAGGRVAVLNVPVTYPAEDVNGIMVSGLDSPALDERAVHPAAFLPELLEASPGYRIISRAGQAAVRGDFEGVEAELVQTLAARGEAIRGMIRRSRPDLAVVNLEVTEKSHHFFWQHLDPSHPRHDPKLASRYGGAIGRIYAAVDQELGRLVEAVQPDTVFVVSDRGAGPSLDWVFFVNDWLAAQGFMAIEVERGTTLVRRAHTALIHRLSVPTRRRLRPLAGATIERAKGASMYGGVDWSRTRAYAQLRSAVRMNLVGREPNGTVASTDADATLDEIATRARAVCLPDGRAVFTAVCRAGELYDGDPPVPGGPDLIMVPASGMHVKSRDVSGEPGWLKRQWSSGVYMPSGVHTDVGMAIAAGAGIQPRGRVDKVDIHQLTPSVLEVMGVDRLPGGGVPFPFVMSW